MKLSCILVIAASASSASAFVLPTQISSSSITLNAVNGEDIRDERGTFAGHGTGVIGSFERDAPQAGAPIPMVMGEDVRHGRTTYAAHGTGVIGSFERDAPQAGAPIPMVMGEDVRHGRTTYAAHGTGEIGSDSRQPFVPQSAGSDGGSDHEGDWMT
eukprot:CAMPEP_0201621738 /NCGR_PEP_ID=MMETSP0492-20130828/47042_1 /ASSEMBLY_ACC=CAM_ASM_000837 /TAXON_ID=420259 /ORGANISM="Thalassiosira gravida, Strain GMp14c1" /LENGTH=156 /DNA_ID=CAMNT_0048091299 /DNA_START=139 /DNA_END=609 /DNA_ORIENTATION=+